MKGAGGGLFERLVLDLDFAHHAIYLAGEHRVNEANCAVNHMENTRLLGTEVQCAPD